MQKYETNTSPSRTFELSCHIKSVDRQTDGWIDRQTYRWTDAQIDKGITVGLLHFQSRVLVTMVKNNFMLKKKTL